jgi:hypothetical protein
MPCVTPPSDPPVPAPLELDEDALPELATDDALDDADDAPPAPLDEALEEVVPASKAATGANELRMEHEAALAPAAAPSVTPSRAFRILERSKERAVAIQLFCAPWVIQSCTSTTSHAEMGCTPGPGGIFFWRRTS